MHVPTELIFYILFLIDIGSIFSFCITCRSNFDIFRDLYLWQTLLDRDYRKSVNDEQKTKEKYKKYYQIDGLVKIHNLHVSKSPLHIIHREYGIKIAIGCLKKVENNSKSIEVQTSIMFIKSFTMPTTKSFKYFMERPALYALANNDQALRFALTEHNKDSSEAVMRYLAKKELNKVFISTMIEGGDMEIAIVKHLDDVFRWHGLVLQRYRTYKKILYEEIRNKN